MKSQPRHARPQHASPNGGGFLIARAVAGLGLMVAFYALGFGMVLGLLALPIVLFYTTGYFHLGFAAASVGGAIAVYMAVAPRFDEFTPSGPRLIPERQPRLFAELGRVAAAARQSLPKEVYLTNGVEAWVARRRGFMGIGSRRVMGIGLPLLQAAGLPELRAVLAHEFGHFRGGDAGMGAVVYSTHAAVVRTLEDFPPSGLGLLFHGYARLFFRVTAAISRRQEHRADALACDVGGAAAFRRALLLLPGTEAAFYAYWSGVLLPVLEAGFLPPVAAGFAAFLSRPEVRTLAQRAQEDALRQPVPRPYDTHPQLAERLSALPGEPGAPPHAEPATTLLDGLPELEDELLDIAFARRARLSLVSIAWSDVGPRIYVPRWTRLLRRHAKATAGLTPSSLPDLDWKSFCRSLAAATGSDARDAAALATELVVGGVALALVRSGFAAEISPLGVAMVHPEERIVLPDALAGLQAADAASRWRELCARTGIGDMRFETVAAADGS